MDIFKESHKILYGHKDIHGEALRRQELIERLRPLPPGLVVNTLSKLGILLTNVERKDLTPHLAQIFLRQDTLKKLARKIQAHGRNDIFLLTDRSACILLEFARRYCRGEMPREVDKEYLYQIGECMLISNDLANEASLQGHVADQALPSEERNREIRRTYSSHLFREILFNQSEQFRYTLARSKLIYDLLKDQVPAAERVDLSADMDARFEFSLEDYFLASLAVWVYWSGLTLDWDHQFTNIDTNIIFPGGPRKEKFLKVLEYLTQDFQTNADIPTDRTGFHEWQYKFFGMRSQPLLRSDGRLYCASMKFIGDLFWQGPYYLVMNHFPEVERLKFTRYLGHAIEGYVLHLLKDCLGQKVGFHTTGEGHPIGDCVIEMRKNWRVVVEVKGGRADTPLQTRAVDPALSNKARQMLFEGLEQLSDRTAEMRADGYKGQITPLLITGGNFPVNFVVWDHLGEQVNGLPLFTDKNIDFPQVMDLEAIETICAFVKAGIPFGEIIRKKLKPKWVKEDATIFFMNEIIPALGKEPAHPALIALNHEIFNDLALGLALNERAEDVEYDWRGFFSIGPPTV